MDVTKLFKVGRGRGSTRGTGIGRGRGRGRGRGSTNKIINLVNLDDDDEVCNMALEQAELENNSLTKAFEVLNAASELEGFDPLSGSIWIYPTNRTVRDYQFEIVKTALFNNTLVSLPTGLGKTFISAVVMYNFQRWYPTGIIVFMAPTRPLVTQQLDACHNTVGISPAKTVELTGQIPPKKRQQLWLSKTVFFLTPQVMLSDLERDFFPAEKVRCIVVDEAHKALGNHAYVQVITKISQKNRLFRVLALSATPGSDIVAVKQVFKNLLISRVELRSENSLDILPYIHDKKVEKIVVKLDDYLKHIHDQLLEVFQTYSGKLMKANALSGRDGTSYSKFQLLKSRETFRKDMASKLPNYQKGYIEVDYAICISLAHSIEILLSHGLRTFYIFLHGVLNKEKGTPAVTAELKKNACLQNLLSEIQRKLNISVENSTFDFDLSTSGLFSEVGSPMKNVANRSFLQEDVDYTLSHPKLKVLKDVVHKHFLEYQMKNGTTRVMIFSQYRDSVQEIGNMLNSLRPMVKPMVFIGQANTSAVGRGLKQKDQVQVVQQFRDGGFNCLVSTSVGEEGLDIGEVDLIICFDASKSPTRLIQRMGRTGRQREGRTVFLLTQGKEERSYMSSISLHSSISKSITDANKLQPFLYKQSPRMVPMGLEPTCYKMSIILSTEQSTQPEPMQVDIEDDDGDTVPSKAIKQKTKQAPIGKKKKNEAAGTNRKKATSSEKNSTNSIAKLFERMNKGSSQNTPKRQIEERSPKKDPPMVFDNDDAYCYEEGMHMFVENNSKALDPMSVYPKIFDIDKPGRLEWTPCTTFLKSKPPPSDAVSSATLKTKFECLLLDEKELAAIDFGIKSRESFSYLKKDFCGCGNTMEAHEVGPDYASYNVRMDSNKLKKLPAKTSNSLVNPVMEEPCNKTVSFLLEPSPQPFNDDLEFEELVSKNQSFFENSIILEQPFIDEEFVDDLHLIMEDDFFSPAESDIKDKDTNSPIKKTEMNLLPKTPEKDSSTDDDDVRSQFSASPEIIQNRFLAELKEIKAAKAAASCGSIQSKHVANAHLSSDKISSNTETKSLQLPGEDNNHAVVSAQSFSMKKFKFKKKLSQNPVKVEEKHQPHQLSPSPPLSPILKLPVVKNDLFIPPATGLRAAKVSSDVLFDEEYRENSSTYVTSSSRNTSNLPVALRSNKDQKSPAEDWRPKDTFLSDIVEQPYKPEKSPNTGLCTTKSKAVVNKSSSIPKKETVTRLLENCHVKKPYSASSSESLQVAKKLPTDSNNAGQVPRTNRQSLKIVTPEAWKYGSNDISFSSTQPEPRPIVRTYPTLNSHASISASTVGPKETEPGKVGNSHSARENFSKSPSVASAVSSTTSNNQRPVKNLLTRNRPRKHLTTSTSSSSYTNTTTKNESTKTAAKAFTLQSTPTKVYDLDDSDDSPEIVLTKLKTPLHVSRDAAEAKRALDIHKQSTPINFSSSHRSGDRSRFLVPDPDPRRVTKSPTTPNQSRFVFSRKSLTYPVTPVSNNVSVASRSPSCSPYVLERQKRQPNRRRRNANPFIESQATVSDDESDGSFGDENEFEFEGLDDMDDSFVTHEDETSVTDSQQVMYLESVKDSIPVKFGRIEKPLSPKHYGNDLDLTGESYEDDSFCQEDDDVEYMDVGVFTQAMNQARAELAVSNSGRQTRRGKREAMAVKNSESESHQPKQRRRIVTIDDSSSDDEDFE